MNLPSIKSLSGSDLVKDTFWPSLYDFLREVFQNHILSAFQFKLSTKHSHDLDSVKNELISAWAFHEPIYRSDALVETPYFSLDPQSQGHHKETHTKHQVCQPHLSPPKRWLHFLVCQKISDFLSCCTIRDKGVACANIPLSSTVPRSFSTSLLRYVRLLSIPLIELSTARASSFILSIGDVNDISMHASV